MSSEKKFLKVPIWIWEGVQGLVAAIGIVSVLFGVFWAVYQYSQSIKADRARATIELLDVWETRGYLDNYRSLDQRVLKIIKEAPDKDVEAARSDDAIRKTLYEKVALKVLEDKIANEEFESLVYFFQRLHLCVEASLCSAETTSIFFDDTLSSFITTFRTPLLSFRGGVPEFVASLD